MTCWGLRGLYMVPLLVNLQQQELKRHKILTDVLNILVHVQCTTLMSQYIIMYTTHMCTL